MKIDKKRIQAYRELIKKLLTCSNEEEVNTILMANPELVDEVLLVGMNELAAKMSEDGHDNTAQWLIFFAERIAKNLAALATYGITTEEYSHYLPLVEKLLHCPNGEEEKILQVNSSLVNERLVKVMKYVAVQLKYQKNKNYRWLNGVAELIEEYLAAPNIAPEEYSQFLREILKGIPNISNPESFYPFLEKNLDKLNDRLLKIIQSSWLTKVLKKLDTQIAIHLASNIINFSMSIGQFPLGNVATNIEIAITLSKDALGTFTKSSFPQEWATIQNSLGVFYRNRIRGDRADNIEAAINAYQNALCIHTQSSFPQDWARIQNNLGNAYRDRVRGDRADNIEAAINAYQNALIIRTKSSFPKQWATTQNNLGAAYCDRTKGDEAQNIECAIAAYKNALLIRTSAVSPEDWATTQHDLGLTYQVRIKGDKAQNIECAIAAYKNALLIHTQSAFPTRWALNQSHLGIAYQVRIKGDIKENLEAAISAYENSLLIYTPEALPGGCIVTAGYLGSLHFKNQNWAKAIQAYQQAIQALEITRTWALDDNRRQEIISEGIEIYGKIVIAAVHNQQFSLALETVERSRSLSMLDLMEGGQAYDDSYISPELQQHVQDYELLQQRINALRMPQAFSQGQRLVTARDSGSTKITEADLQIIRELEAEKQEIWQKMRRLDPILAGQKQVDPLNLSQMQSLIDNEVTALLSFYTTNNDTYIFILKAGQPPQVYTCEGKGLEALQDWILDNWINPYLAEKNQWFGKMGDFLTQLSQRLQINDLIAQHLTDIEELIIVPHIFLHQIPFAALPIDPPQPPLVRGEKREKKATENSFLIKGGAEGGGIKNTRDTKGIVIKPQPKPTKPTSQPSQYLSDRFRLRVVPSCQILHYCHQRPTIDSQIMGMVEDATEDLVYTGYECETIAQQYQIPANLRLRGNQATTSNYRHLSQQVNILHSSHHASAELDNPLDSKLLLADGFLTLGQLFSPGWRMPNLSDVFASCCEVNFTLTKITDDMFTLATGFLCAGARNVVSTLWSVDDFATALLAIFYYDFRNSNLTRSQSLQKAQQKLRNLTGKELEEKYQTQLQNHLQQRQTQINQALETAKAKGDEEKVEKLQQLAEKIVKQKKNLSDKCEQEYPFASPFYWAGFVSQGLA